jgi:hypothetical protein
MDLKKESIKNNPQRQKEIKDEVVSYMSNKDMNGLIIYVNTNEDAMEYVQNDSQLYLLFTGPRELQVVKLLQYKKQGLSDSILSSQIRSQNKAYKKYSLDEIQKLINLGLSDKLLTTMIDVTTQVEKEKRAELTKIQPIQTQNTVVNTQVMQAQQEQTSSSNTSDMVMEKAGEVILDQLLRNLF